VGEPSPSAAFRLASVCFRPLNVLLARSRFARRAARATTHWQRTTPFFSKAYPQVKLEPEPDLRPRRQYLELGPASPPGIDLSPSP